MDGPSSSSKPWLVMGAIVVLAAFALVGLGTALIRMVSNPELVPEGLMGVLLLLAFGLFAAVGVGRRYIREPRQEKE